MFRRFLSSLFGKKKSQTRRPVRRTQLSVEALEGRELMSATAPGFTLHENGALYNTTGAHAKLIDTGVQEFTVVHNKVYDLHSKGGILELMNVNGSGKVVLAGGVQSLSRGNDGNAYYLKGSNVYSSANKHIPWDTDVVAMAVAKGGSLFTLKASGNLYRFTGSSNSLWDQKVQQITVSSDGSLFTLKSDRKLYRLSPTSGNSLWAEDIQAIGHGNDGEVYYQQNGSLYNAAQVAAGQPGVVRENVLAMAQGPNGRLWLNLGQEGMRLYNPADKSYPGWGVVQGFAVGNDGNLYFLQSGHLWRAQADAPHDDDVHGDVLAMAQGPNGQIWVNLGQDGLRLYNPANPSYPAYGVVQGFAVGNDGNAYYLQNGILRTGTSGWVVHQDVLAMAQGPNGQIWVNLGQDGLRLYNPATSSYPGYGVVQDFGVGTDAAVYYVQKGTGYVNGRAVWSNTKDIAVAQDGTLFWLSDYGLLQSLVPGGNWQNLATGVSSFGLRNDQNVYLLHNNNDLTLNSPAGTLLADFGHVKGFGMRNDGNAYLWNDAGNVVLNTPSKNIDFGAVYGTFIGFSAGADGSGYLLTANGLFFRNTPTQNITISSSVQSFAIGGDGAIYMLDASGNLLRSANGNAGTFSSSNPLPNITQPYAHDSATNNDYGFAAGYDIRISVGNQAFVQHVSVNWAIGMDLGTTALAKFNAYVQQVAAASQFPAVIIASSFVGGLSHGPNSGVAEAINDGSFDTGNIAPDGYQAKHIVQGQTGDCVFCAALASAGSQGVNLGGLIHAININNYIVSLVGEANQTVVFDGTIYASDIQLVYSENSKQLANAWAIILQRGYLQAHGVDWRSADNNPGLFSAWASPKVAQYSLIGGTKGNWNVGNGLLGGGVFSGPDRDALQKMSAALQAHNIVTVGCWNSAVIGSDHALIPSGHEFAVLGMNYQDGRWVVTLFNPHNDENGKRMVSLDGAPAVDVEGTFDLSWLAFEDYFATFTTCGQDV